MSGLLRTLFDHAGQRRTASALTPLALRYRAATMRLVAAATINRTYDQPWLANRNVEGTEVFIDRRVPRILPKTGIDTDKTLPVHELSEFLAMGDGLRYDRDSPGNGPTAHNDVATPLERQAVEAQRPGEPDIWKRYTDEMDGYIRRVDDETITHVAPDQDLRQFAEDDRALLKKIIAVERPSQRTHDAIRSRGSFDPTGTSTLRSKFRGDLDRRWTKLRQLASAALAEHDIVGLGKPTVGSISAAASVTSPTPRLPHGDRVKGFQVWLDEALRQIVLGNDGAWTAPYVRKAAQMGMSRAHAHTGKGDIPKPDVLTHMQSSVSSELRGICAAVSQQATRVVAQGILSRKRPAKVARDVALVIRSVGVRRGHALVSLSVVKAFNDSLLDGLRSAGVTRVGVVPEKLRVVRGAHGLTKARDAEAPCIHLSLLRDAKRRKTRQVDLSRVDVLTAGDENVCPACEDLSDNGPYDIDEIEGVLPLHLGCRCSYVPSDDLRFASVHEDSAVHDAFDPDEPRNEHGEWTEGGSINTKAFKEWFGASKVVGKGGRPLVVYHGTTNLDAFARRDAKFSITPEQHRTDFGNFGLGVYMTPKEYIARAYSRTKSGVFTGDVIPLYAKIENPLRIEVSGPEYTKEVDKVAAKLGVTATPEWKNSGQYNEEFARQFREKALAAGYDGVITKDIDGSMGAEVVAFNPEQVKHATENKGKFNPKSTAIRDSHSDKKPCN